MRRRQLGGVIVASIMSLVAVVFIWSSGIVVAIRNTLADMGDVDISNTTELERWLVENPDRFGLVVGTVGDSCALSAGERAQRASALIEGYLRTPNAARLPTLRAQRERLACVGARGMPLAFSRVLGQVAQGTGLPPAVSKRMREHLEWPMEFAGNQLRFERFGAKGGSMPGVLTEAMYLVPKTGPLAQTTRVAVLFIDGLKTGEWLKLTSSFLHQELMVELATRPERVAVLRDRLASPRP